MKTYYLASFLMLLSAACSNPSKQVTEAPKKTKTLDGTWHLISSKSIQKGDTTITTPPKDQEMLKMFNATNFAFFTHDLMHGQTAKPFYSSGAGTYTLNGDDYTEHLAYCDARSWENRDFKFKLTVSNDTLVQKGIEKIDSLKVDREIIETYVKINKRD
ncbi:hypothetical protein LX99_01366 [Mucilaginibacter oryzae]|uniref:Lipocalin-like protein n=1 Tax=Mucilaginibacter oryzae TaxID=468058 RepID=A0A316HFG9_9SPHI|nr:hypothetical protein [Mucilaginibacter oryzae]PWK78913.1 hypothetical protein LX99_01366 [Mucilaginibacter oryzae]